VWFDDRVRTTPAQLSAKLLLFGLWALAKYNSLLLHVWQPNEYSDTYYYFLQAQNAATSGGGLAVMTPEYPTPAAALLMIPWWLGGTGYDSYRWNFLVLIVGIDAAFALLLALRSGPGGVLAWTFFETLAGRLTLLRFDVVPAVLAATALLLIFEKRDAAASPFVVLGAAIKLWPALLLPLTLTDRRQRRRALLVGELSVLAVLGACIAVAGADRLTSPVAYQRDRGLQIEAVAATGPLLARLTDPAISIFWSKWNAYEFAGPGVTESLRLADVLFVVGGLGLVALLVRWFSQGASPDAVAYLALFAVAAFMVGSKALSPQYLLWLAAPAAVLLGRLYDLPKTSDAAATLTASWVGVLVALTAYVYPLHYDDILNARAARPVEALAARNVVLAAFAIWVAVAAWFAAARPPALKQARGLPRHAL
jgi:Glycosyltransferase family 87